MNSIILLIIAAVAFMVGYRVYGKKVEHIWQINPQRTPPSKSRYDGHDYIPASNWVVLFGHHFASIAGAGPIIGPAIAVCYWGWGPTALWIILGSIFIGGIHDFGALIISVREDGKSIADISEDAISRRAKLIFSIFTWLALILVIAVFAYLGANTFVTQPEIVLPSFGIIPIAILVGLALYKLKGNSILITVLALMGVAALIFYGSKIPIVIFNTQAAWIIVLLFYSFIASVLPVNLLLQPRDYLSSFLLVFGIILGVVGVVISHPPLHGEPFLANKTSLGWLWPMMFITVACGANSGFHSLVSSGTTSKQLANEKHAKGIGYGGMIMEGFLAIIVVICVVGGLNSLELKQHIIAKTSPVNLFGVGFGNLTAPFLGRWGMFAALTILNIFILTTLDTATRITRYITEELFGIKNRFMATGLCVLMAGILALGRDTAHNPLWQKIWPAFGASNQLVAALALLVITSWLLSKNRPTLYTLLPALFMLITSLSALVWQMTSYIHKGEYLLIIISLILFASALVMTYEVIMKFKKSLNLRRF